MTEFRSIDLDVLELELVSGHQRRRGESSDWVKWNENFASVRPGRGCQARCEAFKDCGDRKRRSCPRQLRRTIEGYSPVSSLEKCVSNLTAVCWGFFYSVRHNPQNNIFNVGNKCERGEGHDGLVWDETHLQGQS